MCTGNGRLVLSGWVEVEEGGWYECEWEGEGEGEEVGTFLW